MPALATYSEFPITSRQRFVAVAVGNKVYCPASNAFCGVIDTMTNTYSEFPIPSRTFNTGVLVGTKIYMPASGQAFCGVIDTTTNTYSEFPIPAYQRNKTVLVGSKLYCLSFYGFFSTVIDTTDNTYTEIPNNFSTGTSAILVGTKIYVPSPVIGVGTLVLDTTTNTSTTISTPAFNYGKSILAGTKIYVLPGNDDRLTVIDTLTNTSTTARKTSQINNTAVPHLWQGTIFAPRFNTPHYGEFTPGDTATLTGVVGWPATSRQFVGTALVGNKIYCPANLQGICGVFTLPLPPDPPVTLGIYRDGRVHLS